METYVYLYNTAGCHLHGYDISDIFRHYGEPLEPELYALLYFKFIVRNNSLALGQGVLDLGIGVCSVLPQNENLLQCWLACCRGPSSPKRAQKY